MTDLNRRKALQTTLNDLTQKGIKQGFLTMEDIANAQITGTEHVDAATAYFEAKGIKIIRPEEGNEEKQPPKRRARKRRADRSNEFLYDEDRPEDELTSDGSGEDIVAKITAAQQKKEVSKDELDATTRYLNEIYAFPPLTEAEELPLLLSAKAGDLNARERVINASLRIVVPQARVYLSSATSFQFVDLINEGSIGLMTAIDRFDPSKKTRFATYAAYWVQQSIWRAMQQRDKQVRIPYNVSSLVKRCVKLSREIELATGETPSPEELADRLGVTPKRVILAMTTLMVPDSLDRELTDGNSGEVKGKTADFISDGHMDSVFESTERRMMGQSLHQKIQLLPLRERAVIYLRFGVVDGVTHTLEEIANELGCTRQGTRDLEKRAIQRLRESITTSLEGYDEFSVDIDAHYSEYFQ